METLIKCGGRLAGDFFDARSYRFRRFTGGKSRNLQEMRGGKGTARRAAELISVSLVLYKALNRSKLDGMTRKNGEALI